LHNRAAKAREGGSQMARERHTGKGKRLPRERIQLRIDAGSPFLEIGTLAANGRYDDDAPCAGIISGIGRGSGREVMIG
ncbi:carboxyl transferase domain-containing protein, partial [Rhizobium leguminosarum]|uniref:carboxyl transferase domain-containing protein n=1 Tax=Rhizobium leguminosarum TaxID=384 RepID=UPI003F97072F